MGYLVACYAIAFLTLGGYALHLHRELRSSSGDQDQIVVDKRDPGEV